MIELRDGDATCVVSARDGGRLASLRVRGQPLLIERSADDQNPMTQNPMTQNPMTQNPMTWGSFPMVPFAGRVREGRFEFGGRTHQLPLGLPPHAIHGTVYTVPWEVVAHSATTAELTCSLGGDWPFGGTAGQRIELHRDRIVCDLWVTAGRAPMPVLIGWHPWFVKPRSSTMRFASQYERGPDGLPTGRLIATTDGPWDDCFIEPLEPVSLRIGNVDVTVASDCSHWVIFDELAHTTCVEPQSGPPDAFNICPVALQPGASLGHRMTLHWG